jgi:hypothetical protein
VPTRSRAGTLGISLRSSLRPAYFSSPSPRGGGLGALGAGLAAGLGAGLAAGLAPGFGGAFEVFAAGGFAVFGAGGFAVLGFGALGVRFSSADAGRGGAAPRAETTPGP